ncbi:hypothetical protein [Iodidimonas sp. MBR-22]|nr:hypothetical protein [Iodidimonas sp. MBR-22]
MTMLHARPIDPKTTQGRRPFRLRGWALAFIASLALGTSGLIAATPAEAGGGYYGGHGGYGGHSYRGGHGVRGGHGYRGGHRYRGGRHHGRGHGARNVFLGVGAGLLLYHVIDSANENRANAGSGGSYGADGYYQPGDRVYDVAQPPRYAPRPGSIPARSGAASAQGDAPIAEAPSCLQTREYQTTITIAGDEKEAYGTACLMPDGNWKMGAPQLVPDFD